MAQGRVDQPTAAIALRNHDDRIRALEATPEGGGIQFGINDHEPVYGPENQGDWLWIETTEAGGPDGDGIGMLALDGGVAIQSDNTSSGNGFVNISSDGDTNQGIGIAASGSSNAGVTISTTDSDNGGVSIKTRGSGGAGIELQARDSGQILIDQLDDDGIDINNEGAGDTVIEQTGTGNVIAIASGGSNGQPQLKLIGNSNDAPILLGNDNNLLEMLAQSGIFFGNNVNGLSFEISNNASSYLSAAGAGTVGIGNSIELTAYTTQAAAGGPGSVRLYAYDDGSHHHLQVVFGNGTRVNLATN